MRRAILIGLALMLGTLGGCATPQAPLGIADGIVVLPANNLTGDPLLVEGSGLIDRYIRRTGKVSVGDVLQSEARFRLQEKGFDVGDWSVQQAAFAGKVPDSAQAAAALARQAGVTKRVLYLEIRRWEPDAPTHPRFVIVALIASVVDPASGQEIWREHRQAAPVATPGSINAEAAYVVAARRVIAEVLAPLRPAPLLR